MDWLISVIYPKNKYGIMHWIENELTKNKEKKKTVGTDMDNNPWIEEGENKTCSCRWEWKILKSKDGGGGN